ncbi:GGDEF domain-containing protein [Odoribacter sp. OttesenSCG-928-J03]|nr:GGDEF domain-containing protein [Odoribacter sp. OttesenSCG-928-J03]MDL2283157.1 GGDEF domain-containing protein [Odoribacter sp. OttesenSCG-928-G04]MDL2330513.1 GGDEF domain-containing protein [Odoribacter sp. OttesenSCG-928-A06]
MNKKENLQLFAFRVIDILNSSASIESRVTQALHTMGDYFQYERGFVYQTNVARHFHLQEAYGNENGILREEFKVRDIPLRLMSHLTKDAFYHCCVENCASKTRLKEDEGIVDFFDVDSLLLIHFKDVKGMIIGFVGFANKIGGKCLEKEEFTMIQTLLSLIAKEVTIREHQNREIQAKETLENIMDNTGVDIYVNDFETHEMLYANKTMAAPYGGKGHFNGKKCWAALYKDKTGQCEFCPQKKLIDEKGNPSKVYSWDYERPFDKSWFRVFSAAFRWIDGRMAHVVTSVDITENKRSEALVKQMAEQDALTGLPNRRKLVMDCDQEITRTIANSGEGYLMFLDLDGFKAVNDSMGHKGGDELLIQVARFFEGVLGRAGKVYRQSGDEFVIIVPNSTREMLVHLSKTIIDRFSRPWVLEKGNAYCNVSIGIAQYPADADNAEDLLQVADAAMYAVKRGGKKGSRFAHELVNITF